MKRFLLFLVLGIAAILWLRVRFQREAFERARREQAQVAWALEDYQRTHPGAPVSSGVFVRRDANGLVLDDVDRRGRTAYLHRDRPAPRQVAQAEFAPRESVGDIPVPIVPGSRVTEAEAQPPQPYSPFPEPPSGAPEVRPYRPQPRPHPATSPPPPADVRTIVGQLSATEDRARDDARRSLDRQVVEWVAPEVPVSWKIPTRLIDAMVVDTQVRRVEKDLGTLYEATIRATFSAERRGAIVAAYSAELVARRLTLLAGVIAFVLACLAALAGYIRTDEATKGYYTTHLRLAAAAGVGAAGAVIYQMLG